MTNIKTQSLSGNRLDFWVAKALGYTFHYQPTTSTDWFCRSADGRVTFFELGWAGAYDTLDKHAELRFSRDWATGGPVFDRYAKTIVSQLVGWFGPTWAAKTHADNLKWLMRAFVATHFGEDVPARSDDEVRYEPAALAALPDPGAWGQAD
ncbi:DUF2591 domain-containing protein [Paraburkholderia sp. UCT31]|uniref:phage protein NinX family protein n=1 Tax=Paraburkholderia sp. UCT31 TaxID=2615209 RepID=UPI001654FA16|nr:phage protein NinX family protein [Paraburkholderia sp. UCT31]MBC8739733.1 DUF2591 domain-containing protein [Paraburkholderia sp. UCT31]